MSTGLRILKAIGDALSNAGGGRLAAPASGGTIFLKGLGVARISLPAGTYKIEDAYPGWQLTVVTTGAVVLQNSAGQHICSMDSGCVAVAICGGTSNWRMLNWTQQGFIYLPLEGWREITSNDITNATGNGGVLATDTTPAFETVNGDTDGQLRILWAASNADAIACQVPLPYDMDRTQDMTLFVRGLMGGASDTPVLDIDTFFNEGDTKVEDATTAFSSSVGTRLATIAAADIPATAETMSIELTPGTHGSDAMVIYNTYLSYTRKIIA